MKKFGFRTSSITFKALCIILPIQFLFLIFGYGYLKDSIKKAESEKSKKFDFEKNELEKILKDYPVLRLNKFNKFSALKENPNLIPIYVKKSKTISESNIECIKNKESEIFTDRLSFVQNKLHFSLSIVEDLLIISGKFAGYDIDHQYYLNIDLVDKNKNIILLKAFFIEKDSDSYTNLTNKTEGTFHLKQKKEWVIDQSESTWKKYGGNGIFADGTFDLALKGKNIIQKLHKIQFSLHDSSGYRRCKISPKKISFFLAGILQERMNKIQQMKNGIIIRDSKGEIIFKKNENNPYYLNKPKKQSSLVSFGEFLVSSQNSQMCPEIKQISGKKTLSKSSKCSFLFDKTVYIWSQQRAWMEESLYGIYERAAFGTIVIGVTTILFLIFLLYIGYRYNSLQKEINKYISSDGEIFPSVEKMKSDKNDEIGILAKILKLSFLKIRKRNTFYVKMSDFLRHELGQHFTKLHLKIANFSSKSNQVEIQKSLIKTLELSEKTLQDFTNASNVISALNAGQRKKIDLCAFMEEFIKYFQTSDSNIIFEKKSKTAFAECIPDALERVFSAILENANDFRKKGTAILCFIETKNSQTEIVIRNEGDLIAQKDLRNIFELGFSLRENDNETEGIHQGFGLFLVKSIIEFHGWSITAKNNTETHSVEFVIKVQ